MFKKIDTGSCIEIQDNAFGFVYRCWIPELGYGINAVNGKIEETEILCNSPIPEEQYWIRPELPKDFLSRRKAEKNIQRIDREYFDPYLEEIRRREWRRRLRGIWFWNYNPKTKESEPIYLSGAHYFNLTYWRFQGKYFDFRIPDRDYWYVMKYCEEDDNCLGLNEITKRKIGKTAKAGCWCYERTSRMNNSHAGIQSKSDDDAWEVFKKAVVHAWKLLPDFFRPTYDVMKGDDPNDELRFFLSSRRGSKAEEEPDTEEPLNSYIDFKPSIESAYDGAELDTYIRDEAGKTKKPVSVKEAQNVVRYCSELDGEFKHRKQLYTTTVELEKGEEDNVEFQELTMNSNPLERDANGRTGTGLYTYFLPAYRGMYFDRYGYPDEERAKVFLMNTRKSYENKLDMRGLSSFKRKNPFTLKEAFSADGEVALYNPEILNRRLDEIMWTPHLTEFGDLIWENGDRIFYEKEHSDGSITVHPSKVIWQPNTKGKFEKVSGWFPKEENSIYDGGNSWYPNSNHLGRIGCDPFKYDKTKDKRRSNCAAYYYQMEDELFPDNLYDNCFTLKYSFREESTLASNEDILKMAWWCGSQVMFERNVNHWKKDFENWKCNGFLAWLPGEVEPGVHTDTSTIQTICNYTEAYINKYSDKMYFKSMLRKETGLLGFKVEDHEKYDEPMAIGMTLIAVKEKKYRSKAVIRDIKEYFPNKKAWSY